MYVAGQACISFSKKPNQPSLPRDRHGPSGKNVKRRASAHSSSTYNLVPTRLVSTHCPPPFPLPHKRIMVSSLSLPANDAPHRASDPAVLASRLNWHRPVQSYHDSVVDDIAPVTNRDLIQLPVGDSVSLGTSYEHVRRFTNSSPDPI